MRAVNVRVTREGATFDVVARRKGEGRLLLSGLEGVKVSLPDIAATDLLDWCWWAPTIAVPREDKPRGVFAERAFPGAIVVNSLGRRFVNEAAPYLEFVDSMYKDNAATGGKSIPAWASSAARTTRRSTRSGSMSRSARTSGPP